MTTKQRPADPQVDVADAEPVHEMLTESADGHRTVHRVRARDRAAAEKAVTVPDGATVLGVSLAGCGLGSGDRAPQ
jgi:hypothetical protein